KSVSSGNGGPRRSPLLDDRPFTPVIAVLLPVPPTTQHGMLLKRERAEEVIPTARADVVSLDLVLECCTADEEELPNPFAAKGKDIEKIRPPSCLDLVSGDGILGPPASPATLPNRRLDLYPP